MRAVTTLLNRISKILQTKYQIIELNIQMIVTNSDEAVVVRIHGK